MTSTSIGPKSYLQSNIRSRPNESGKPNFEPHLISPILLKLYRIKMIPKPNAVINTCTFIIASRSVPVRMAIRDEEENMASQEIMISMNVMIHTTLSPSMRSIKPQIPDLLSGVRFSFCCILQASYLFLKYSTSIFEILEQVKACATWRKKNNVSLLSQFCCCCHCVMH